MPRAQLKRSQPSKWSKYVKHAKTAYDVGSIVYPLLVGPNDPSQPGVRTGRGEGTGSTTVRQARSGKILREGSKRGKRRKAKNLRQKVATLERKVNREIKQIYSHTESSLMSSGFSSVAGNTANYFSFQCGSEADFDNLMASVQQVSIDSTGPTTAIVPADFRVIDGSQGILVRQSKKVTFRNNQCIPLKATFYELSMKQSTTITPTTAIFNGLDDRGIPASTAANMVAYWPTDSMVFNEAYKIEQKEKLYMNPGDEFSMTVRTGWQKYNVDIRDHGVRQTFDKDLNTRFIMVRLEGVIVHDSTDASIVGLGPARLDQVILLVSEVKVPDEGNLRRVVNLNSLPSVPVPQICGPNNPDQTV